MPLWNLRDGGKGGVGMKLEMEVGMRLGVKLEVSFLDGWVHWRVLVPTYST